MAQELFKREALDTEGVRGGSDPPSLVLLDVQGTGSDGDAHDLRLVTPAIAVSSVVIWRVGYEDRDKLLGQLQLLHKVAARLRGADDGGAVLLHKVAARLRGADDGGAVRAGGAEFGHLVIALKDAQKYEWTPGAVEAGIFNEKPEAPGHAATAAHRNTIRRSVTRAFRGITVLPMASPRKDEQAYTAHVQAIGQQVHAATSDVRCLFSDPEAPVLASTASDMLEGLVHACCGATVDVRCGQLWRTVREKQLLRLCNSYWPEL